MQLNSFECVDIMLTLVLVFLCSCETKSSKKVWRQYYHKTTVIKYSVVSSTPRPQTLFGEQRVEGQPSQNGQWQGRKYTTAQNKKRNVKP